jgi:hypothetical protein
MFVAPGYIYCCLSQEKNEVMQKQLEALSFLDKRKATKPKLVTDKFPSVSGAPPSSDQMIVAVQQQTPGCVLFFLSKLHGFFLMHTSK